MAEDLPLLTAMLARRRALKWFAGAGTAALVAGYDGRWPHMHFEVFSSLSKPLGGRYAVLTSQFAMPSAICTAIHADATTYPSSVSTFARVSRSLEMVFGDNTSAQIAQQTPAFTGSASTGYTATALIGATR